MGIKAPCIRDLNRFKKTGCPETEWNETRQEGCPAWQTRVIPVEEGIKKSSLSMCIDIWLFRLKFDELALLEGNQRATETFRNGMCTVNDKNETVPKSVTLKLEVPKEEPLKLMK